MYVLDIIPLALIPRPLPQLLSYFCDEKLSFGSLVEVMLNHRKIQGVVVACDSIKSRKLDFKKNVDFELKNISKIISTSPIVSEKQIKIALYISSYYFTPLGIALKTVLPPFFAKKDYSPHNYMGTMQHGAHVKEQVFVLVPEKTIGRYFLEKYKDNIPLFISSGSKIRDYKEVWQKVASGEAEIIVGTRVGLFLPFSNLKKIIIEDESNEAYKSDMMPRYHAVTLAQEVASLYDIKCEFHAVAPRLETLYKFPESREDDSQKTGIIVPMQNEIKAGNFSLLSRKVKEMLQISLDDNENTIIYIPRRGHANFVYCQTCGQSINCPNCSSSLVLHRDLKLICHHCDHSQDKPKQCPNCHGYALKAYGIGIEKVADEVKKFLHFQNYNPKIFVLSGDTAGEDKKEDEIIENWQNTPGGILLATQKIFSYKYLLKPSKIAIISADALIHIPDFRAGESLFRNIRNLASMSSELFIQTYNPDDEALKEAANPKENSFLKNEIQNRKLLGYPPFRKVIRLSFGHRDQNTAYKNSKIVFEKLRYAISLEKEQQDIEVIGPFPGFIARQKSLSIYHILMKVKPETKTTLRNKVLGVVPTGWKVDVDPLIII